MKATLLKAFLWGAGFSAAAFLTILAIDNGKSLIQDLLSTPFHKIEKFEILSKSHRIIESEFGSSYLVITGDIKSTEFLQLEALNISVELRDSSGGFVDSCNCYKNITGSTELLPFKITCRETTSLDQFVSYDFSLEGQEQ